jgi:hypothetical protein
MVTNILKRLKILDVSSALMLYDRIVAGEYVNGKPVKETSDNNQLIAMTRKRGYQPLFSAEKPQAVIIGYDSYKTSIVDLVETFAEADLFKENPLRAECSGKEFELSKYRTAWRFIQIYNKLVLKPQGPNFADDSMVDSQKKRTYFQLFHDELKHKEALESISGKFQRPKPAQVAEHKMSFITSLVTREQDYLALDITRAGKCVYLLDHKHLCSHFFVDKIKDFSMVFVPKGDGNEST